MEELTIRPENNLQQVLQKSTESSTQFTELSLYREQPPAHPDHVKNECKRLQSCFPQIPTGMVVVMAQRVLAKQMSAQQLTDAIDNLIDNYKYPVPTVAEVLSWDKKVKLYTHAEVVKEIPQGFEFSAYDMVTINDQKRWIRKV
jgi:hypothetical protein